MSVEDTVSGRSGAISAPPTTTTRKHPSLFESSTSILVAVVCVFGAIIGMQLIATVGVATNTALIGALAAMILGRIPLQIFARYRSIHVQNLAQSAISAATYGAASGLFVPIGIPFAMGRPDLIIPMFIGASLAMLIDGYLLYRMFNSKVFPASGAWPLGIAAAEAIKAGDEGGRKAVLLGIGAIVGAIGSWFKIPMSAFGIAFIGNIWALGMFGIGLLVRGYSTTLFSNDIFATLIPRGDINAAYIPHGIMIGAGLVALAQVAMLMFTSRSDDSAVSHDSEEGMRRAFGIGTVAYLAIAVAIAVIGGLSAELSIGMLLLFIVYAAFSAFVHELIVGIAAMHSGWFPAFAVALITLLIGMLMGFPPTALALLVGFAAATGPAFADMGYDLKAGWLLRGEGSDPAFELEGRKQQLYAGMAAFVITIGVVFVGYQAYFARDLFPPVDRVFAATIKAGMAPDVAKSLALWAIPGAILQFIGGPKRQLAIMLATGLLVFSPWAGWAVATGIVLRLLWTSWKGAAGQSDMEVVAAGIIAGDALFSFFDSLRANITGRK